MKYGVLLLTLILCSISVSAYTLVNNTQTLTFEMNESYTLVNNTQILTFEMNETTTPITDTCTGTSNCVVTCGTNITISSGSLNMNKYNMSFSGSGTTYLGANMSNFTKISIGNCNIKLNGNHFGLVTSWCYQETANVATSCGGLSTGTYNTNGTWVSLSQGYDGDWSTSTIPNTGTNGSLFINYTKPSSASNNSLWQYNTGGTLYNASIPGSCFSQNPLQFRMDSYRGTGCSYIGVLTYCYNGSSWVVIDNTYYCNAAIYEEGMWWSVSS